MSDCRRGYDHVTRVCAAYRVPILARILQCNTRARQCTIVELQRDGFLLGKARRIIMCVLMPAEVESVWLDAVVALVVVALALVGGQVDHVQVGLLRQRQVVVLAQQEPPFLGDPQQRRIVLAHVDEGEEGAVVVDAELDVLADVAVPRGEPDVTVTLPARRDRLLQRPLRRVQPDYLPRFVCTRNLY